MNNIALITGASSGIGRDLAYIHAEKTGDLILVARREDKLEAIKKDIEEKFSRKVFCIVKDLSIPFSAEEIFSVINQQGFKVKYLINNAGFGGYGYFHERDIKTDEDMLMLNALALMKLSKLFLPSMIKTGFGRIMNVSSVAAFIPGPLQANYYATKAYVQSLTNAINIELENLNVDVKVTALCPGATFTEFMDIANIKNIRALKLKNIGLDSIIVASLGYKGMLAGKAIVTTGIDNQILVHFISKLMPRLSAARIVKFLQSKA